MTNDEREHWERDGERLIAGAFERRFVPDANRLAAIEERLLRVVSRPVPARSGKAWFWWLTLGLSVSAAAGWWAQDFFSGAHVRDEQSAPLAPAVHPEENTTLDRPSDAGSEPASRNGARQSQRSTIYRREVR